MGRRSFYPHLLTFFTCITVVLLSHETANIPARDVMASVFLAIAVASLIVASRVRIRITGSHRVTKKQQPPQPESFTRVSNRLMQLEVVCTLVVPWILLVLAVNDVHLVRDELTVAHLVAPHLFFFQVQILLEMTLMVAQCDASIIFFYTAAANAYRALPLGTCLLRSLVAVVDANASMSLTDWLIVVVLPSIATLLWLYSSLIFLPLEWYPVVVEATRAERA